jgi:hypothetical protein
MGPVIFSQVEEAMLDDAAGLIPRALNWKLNQYAKC